MKAKLLAAYGYQGDAMALPVADVQTSAAFYTHTFGFTLADRSIGPPKGITLERDGIRFAIVESGGDPEQDGGAFHTDDVRELRSELIGNRCPAGDLKLDQRPDGSKFDAFFVIAPDGLCFWFGQRLPS